MEGVQNESGLRDSGRKCVRRSNTGVICGLSMSIVHGTRVLVRGEQEGGKPCVFTLEIWASIARLFELSFVGTCVLTFCVLETHGSNSVLQPRACGLAVRNTRT